MSARALRFGTLALALALAAPARAEAPGSPPAGAVLLPNGLALPYPTLRVFRAFGKCLRRGKRPERWSGRWRSHDHEGLDLGGLGPDGGLGSAVRSLTRARIVEIGRGDELPPKWGVTDRRAGPALRDGELYPRSFELAGYGLVHFFTRARGWYRTGNMVATVGLEGRLAGHLVRYMHLGAARPDLEVGDVLEAGEELGVLGGTAVQDAAPHLHIDIRDADGEAVDVAPLIGLVTSAWCGVPRQRSVADRQAFLEAAAGQAWRPDSWAPPAGTRERSAGRTLPAIDLLRTPEPLVAAGLVERRARFWHEVLVPPPCRSYVVEEDFSSGAYAGHAWRLHVSAAQSFEVAVLAQGGGAAPRLAVVDQGAQTLCHPSGAASTALAVTTLAEGRVRLDASATTDVLVAVMGSEPYRLTLTERCLR